MSPDPRGIQRWATLGFPDAQGEPQCRFLLGQRKVDNGRPLGWLMCNPSRATHEVGDPTAGRVVDHSFRHGFGNSLIANVWPYRTPYPVDLWAALASGVITDAMSRTNMDALAQLAACCDQIVLAFGAEPMRRYPAIVRDIVNHLSRPLLCLGTTDDNMPLHPMARGKHAIRSDVRLRPWVMA